MRNFDDQQRGYRGSKLKDGLEALSNYDANSEYNNQFGHDEMNASFGNNSGRGHRRDSYYQFKRSDSFDSSVGRMQDHMKKSTIMLGKDGSPGVGLVQQQSVGKQPKNPTQSTRNNYKSPNGAR